MEKQISHTTDRELAGPLYGKDPWPLRFHTHSFGAVCFNTRACSIIYCRRQFGTREVGYDGMYYDKPSGPAPLGPWRDRWIAHHAASLVEGRTFSTPLDIEWTSLDGRDYAMSLDLGEVFKDRIVLHEVTRNEVNEAWLSATSIDPVSPHILAEVNDRTISLYMRAMVATEIEQIPGNDRSHFRDDLILAWSRTYDLCGSVNLPEAFGALQDS
ncbi:hypothetical protein J2T07_003769 [Luteibacter jiangsuensis]|uniref:Uncharacterized protein n=1 Tax=Luteibacter jiangsuensis TaxID=637577 RepID=A0ABT9T2S2_9GAMM|nr:hypothetical protein [Luteibacter jiangsuensis]MDQ0011555.1 hypothetical protein [Luteibacter jiangsuensis]